MISPISLKTSALDPLIFKKLLLFACLESSLKWGLRLSLTLQWRQELIGREGGSVLQRSLDFVLCALGIVNTGGRAVARWKPSLCGSLCAICAHLETEAFCPQEPEGAAHVLPHLKFPSPAKAIEKWITPWSNYFLTICFWKNTGEAVKAV